MVKEIKQYDVYWISLNQESDKPKILPCVIVNQMHEHSKTMIIMPITFTILLEPYRVYCCIADKNGAIAVDQIKAVEKARIGSRISSLSKNEIMALKEMLNSLIS